jgi:hypothetical protein
MLPSAATLSLSHGATAFKARDEAAISAASWIWSDSDRSMISLAPAQRGTSSSQG